MTNHQVTGYFSESQCIVYSRVGVLSAKECTESRVLWLLIYSQKVETRNCVA